MAAKPVRITLSRKAGFRLQEHSQALNGLPCVKVDRSTAWGNPFPVGDFKTEGTLGGSDLVPCTYHIDPQKSVELFTIYMAEGFNGQAPPDPKELRGKNLACWCKPGEPCHADVLLELANG